jgi:hypothetical protein
LTCPTTACTTPSLSSRLDSHDNRGVARHERSIEDWSRAGWTYMVRMR